MPTVLKIFSFLWIIHTDDHKPAHVTVYKGTPKNYDAKARVEIATGLVMDSEGFSQSALKAISEVVTDRKEFLQRKWNETRPTK